MFKQGPKPTIGLIGGIGAGKSTAAAAFAARGGAVVDADKIGHAALEDEQNKRWARERWGSRVLKQDGGIDRRAVGAIVFADPSEREALERQVFPWIGMRALAAVAAAQAEPAAKFVVVDAAVMLEAGWNNVVDRIVYIDAPRELRVARLVARSGWDEAQMKAREAAQWPADVKKAAAEAVLVNDAGPEKLHRQIDRLLADWGIPSVPVVGL
jgi:dephospho-CoA kinase